MFITNKHVGFALLELLLVIAIVASLLALSLNRYHQYQQHLKVEAIEQDVNLIFEALSQYYHTQTCSNVNGVPGVFPSVNQNLMPNLVAAHFLAASELSTPSPILQYQAFVVDSLQRNANNKPLYEWQVIATLDANANLLSYKKLLDAQRANTSNSTLLWSIPASTTVASPNTPFWILNSHLERFKNQQAPYDDSCV